MSKKHWIKLSVHLFENVKIKHLRKMKDGDSMVLLWIYILTLDKQLSGKLEVVRGLPFDAEYLSQCAGMDKALVDKALEQMLKLKMLAKKYGSYYVVGWRGFQQSPQELAEYREKQRAYKRAWRERQKEKRERNCPTKSQEKKSNCPTPYIREKEEEKDIDSLKREEECREEERDAVSTLCERYDTLCCALGERESGERGELKKLLQRYDEAQITLAFEKAGRSSYLAGQNERAWRADFNWLTNPKNMQKVLDGRYDDKSSGSKMTAYERAALEEMLE